MIPKDEKNLTLEERRALVAQLHSDDEYQRKLAIDGFLKALDSYIYHLIHKNFAGYIGMIEDLAQSGRLAIIEHAKDYNPEFKLTTFFSFHIQNALQDVVNKENGESHYYAESKNIIVKTIRELGLDFDNIDEQVLALHLNMTTGRLHSILEKTLNKKKVELIEEDGDTSSDVFDSPEEAFIKAEKQREYRACLEELDKYEQIVLCLHFGFPYPKWNPDEKTYKLNEIQKMFDKNGIDANAINVYRSARRHIADIFYKRGIINKRNRYQTAKDDVGLKFKDEEAVMEMFDALNEELDSLEDDTNY